MNKTHVNLPCWPALICGLFLSACGTQGLPPWNNQVVQPVSTILASGIPFISAGKDATQVPGPAIQDAPVGDAGNLLPQTGAETNFTPAKNLRQDDARDWYHVYFTQPTYADDATDIRAKDILYALIGAINQSQSDLAIAIYMLDRNDVGEAILAASRRGVSVRMVTDGDSLSQSPTLQKLKKAGISIVGDHSPALMHDKFMVVDQKGIWSGSYNWTSSCTYRNDNNAIYIESSQLAQDYLQEFDEMYYNKHFGEEKKNRTLFPYVTVSDASIEVCFSPPGKCAEKVAKAVSRAQKSIRFMAFAFTSDPIAEALAERQRAGVDIAGVIETYQSDKPGGDFAAFQNLKMNVLLDGNPYNMHHKVFILDEQTVILGSFNFTRSADMANDENLLIISDRQMASLYLDEFERVYAQAQNPAR
jgi:phosphatidylserine/phosphatidylglycerophosphate/cardiolipin synthase-like enzyme